MVAYHEHVVDLEACEDTRRCDILAFRSELVTNYMGGKVRLILLRNGFRVFSVRMAWKPVARPVRLRGVALV